MQDVAKTLRAQFPDPDKVTLASVARQWPMRPVAVAQPRSPTWARTAAAASARARRSPSAWRSRAPTWQQPVVTVLGDGDFMMGGHAICTAVKHKIPLLVVINNNQSYFNDELHQENIARRRNRAVGNRWIGQSITGPASTSRKFVESQGAVGIGPVKTLAELEAAMKKGAEILGGGRRLPDRRPRAAGRRARPRLDRPAQHLRSFATTDKTRVAQGELSAATRGRAAARPLSSSRGGARHPVKDRPRLGRRITCRD